MEREKTRRVERRRNLELHGYSEDLKMLQKKIRFYEKYTTKLKKLVEEDYSRLFWKRCAERRKMRARVRRG